MKSFVFFAAGLLAAQQAGARANDHYGPNQCVSIARSQTGSCVFRTECKGVDLGKFEFAFVCGAADGSSKKHSFGLGGFDGDEEYDTEVRCASCLAPLEEKPKAGPPQTLLAHSGAGVASSSSSAKRQGPTKEEIYQVVKYGPGKCVSTYPSEKGTCILKTDCADKALEGFELGLVCADKNGEMVRHMFGADSFHTKETFDTLIPCSQCLSLDNFDSGKDTEEAVLKDEVEGLKSDFDALNQRVTKLEQGAEQAQKQEESKAVAEDPKAGEKAFLRASSAKHRQQAEVLRVPHGASAKQRGLVLKKKSGNRFAAAHQKAEEKEEEEEDEENDREEEEQEHDEDEEKGGEEED